MESLTPKITCAVHEKTMPSTIPTIYSVDSNCEKDVNEVTLTNHNSNSSEGNSVKDDSSSLKRKLSDEVPKLEEMLKKCKAQYSNQEKVKENFERTSELAQIMDDLFRRSQICIRGLRDFINTKGFLFMTPLSDLKSHPLFQNLDTTFGDGIDTTLIRAPKVLCTSSEKDLTNDGLEVLKVLSRSKPNLPSGCIKRKDLLPGSEVWVMKTNLVDVFVEGTVLSICDVKPEKLFKVRFNETNTIAPKLYTAKQLAYRINSDIIAPVGTRIIARYSDGIKPKLYAGIVAEPPKTTNLERYLIFFDDGYAQYIEHKDIYVMCAQSIDVADDVHKNICKFIKTYLQKYPERPMLKLQKDQITKTEYDREWWDTKVMDVDASMVKMYFIASNRTEWIYRGSTRLKPLYDELSSASRNAGKHRRHNIVPRKPHQPYVEYTRDTKEVEDIVTLDSDSEEENEKKETSGCHLSGRKTGDLQNISTEKPRNTARKSTTWKPRAITYTHVEKVHAPDLKSHLGYKDLHNLFSFTRVNYMVHVCGPQCREKDDPVKFKGFNPFLIPIYLGWERQLRRYKKGGAKLKILYRSPCGIHLRDLEEIVLYLKLVSSKITIDFFSMNPYLVVFRTFRAREMLFQIDDVTNGKENVPVSCVNSWENTSPPPVEYAAKRFAGPGVVLNEKKEFLVGCTCTDNCQDSERCECQRITNTTKIRKNSSGHLGYNHRRLKESVVTGVYECNSRCKCGPQCGNRVVQNGLQVRLQMFKTCRKGWGIRCLDDLDAGMFICIYAGQILTEQGADEDGNQFGDEYLAELDHIEVAEKVKEDYESDVEMEDFDVEHNKVEINDDDYYNKSEEQSSSSDSDVNICDTDSDFESGIRSTRVATYTTRSRRKSHLKNSDSSSNASLSSLGINDDSTSNMSNKKIIKNKELPDLFKSLDSFTLFPRPLSPASAVFLDKTELKRIPKISENENGVKSVAKKSFSVKYSGCPSAPKIKVTRSTRSFFGEESLYIMDAKSKGNIGRYLNHSCSPNVFVQNVFVNTHDLRFPEVAFFAQSFIQAGTELTWDYNYEVGSVSGKVMYCYCDSRLCRGRLL